MTIVIVVILSSIIVYIDAKKLGVKKGLVPDGLDAGPFGWALGVLFLWIIVLPMYLFKRSKYVAAQSGKTLNS
ncbi:MAG: hypothetical protein JST16_06480 [Bdellovibrionales bacterium]|nr:hypothetical protein [Bdellovibrionales bacterium]